MIDTVKDAEATPALEQPFAELGLPNYEQTGYVGIMVTGGTPAPIIAKLNASINEVRWVAAWDVTAEDVDSFASDVRETLERG